MDREEKLERLKRKLEEVENKFKESQKKNKYHNLQGTKPVFYKNDLIFQRLKMANEMELMGICLDLKINYKPLNPYELISKKYRQAAGHSLLNVTRSAHSLHYKRILIDVADKLKPGVGWTEFKMEDNFTEIEIEDRVIEYANRRFEKEFSKLSPEERKRASVILEKKLKDLGVNQAAVNTTITAFTSGSIGVALATPAALSVFYSSTQTLIAAIFGSAIVPTTLQLFLTGTGIGIAVAAPILAVTLGGPAYRKIIPVTLKLIAIRKRHEVSLLPE